MPEKLLNRLPTYQRAALVELAASMVTELYRLDMDGERVAQLRRALVNMSPLERAALVEIFSGVSLILELSDIVWPPGGAPTATQ